MDTTPKYIKQCEKAEEIQNIRQGQDVNDRIDDWWQNGDFIYSKDDECIFNVCGLRHCANSTGYFDEDNLIWLPTQAQLQKMVFKIEPPHWTLVHGLLMAIEKRMFDGSVDITYVSSMEQLWLAFVMHEKYGKHWDNEKKEWVK